jgi:maltose/moltooligosaccharide transporter
MQSFLIGLGGSIASALPWLLSNIFNVSRVSVDGAIPNSVKYAFYIGGSIFFVAILYTILTSDEYPPSHEDQEDTKGGFSHGLNEIYSSIVHMPKKMKQLALVQFFTWPGLFLMWFYYSTAVARNIFGAESEKDVIYTQGVEFAGLTLSFYSIITFLFALLLPTIAGRIGRKLTHSLCLLCGALGLIGVGLVSDKNMLYLCMTGVGIAWASILSMPYAMLAGSLPSNKVGIYMGIFNFFIVLPEIIASLFFGWIMQHLLDNNRMAAVQIGGILMILASLICYFLVSEKHERVSKAKVAKIEIEEQRPI